MEYDIGAWGRNKTKRDGTPSLLPKLKDIFRTDTHTLTQRKTIQPQGCTGGSGQKVGPQGYSSSWDTMAQEGLDLRVATCITDNLVQLMVMARRRCLRPCMTPSITLTRGWVMERLGGCLGHGQFSEFKRAPCASNQRTFVLSED
eukprot:288700-Amphidinium_carterae.1